MEFLSATQVDEIIVEASTHDDMRGDKQFPTSVSKVTVAIATQN